MEQFKKAQIILLPTNKTANIGANNWYLQKTNTLIINNLISNLYIISDDKIKQNDWCLNISKNIIYQKDKLPMDIMWKKIIATTDTSLKISKFSHYSQDLMKIAVYKDYLLPQPSQEFIEKYIKFYNKDEIITDILVEYETNILYPIIENNNLILKVNSKDNTITIKKLKDNWNREEIIKLMLIAYSNASGYVACLNNNEKQRFLSFSEVINKNI